jgi:hypothetical protein
MRRDSGTLITLIGLFLLLTFTAILIAGQARSGIRTSARSTITEEPPARLCSTTTG